MDYYIILVVVVCISIPIVKIVYGVSQWRKTKKNKQDQDNFLRSRNVVYSKVLEWYNEYETNLFRVIVDDRHGCIYVSKGTNPNDFDRIPYHEIIDYQVRINNDIDITNIHYIETFISSFEATIYRQNLSKPSYVFDFAKAAHNRRMNPNHLEYVRAVKFAEDLHAVLKAIKSR